MNFTQVMNFLSKHIHTVLFLTGSLLIVIAISFLSNVFYGLIALGAMLMYISYLIS